MGVRQFKPVTASSRSRSISDFSEITRTHGEKSLMEPLVKSGGRDNHGHIAMRRIGGGHKRMYRVIDFKRNKHGVAATVREIEDRKSTRLNSSHLVISYAVFCLKKKRDI